MLVLTDFALATLFSAQEHTAMAIRHQTASQETCPEALARLHGLHSQVGAHGLWYRVEVFACLQALLRQSLDLGTSIFIVSRIRARDVEQGPYLFWNQIWTERSVMLISSAIRSRTLAVGVGFLLNSISSVVSWSCVARCRFWFFCCCVRVLLRGGRFEEEPALCELEVEGDGVCPMLPAETGVGTVAGELADSKAADPGPDMPESSTFVAISGW